MAVDLKRLGKLGAEEERAIREVARLMLSWAARLGGDSRVGRALEAAATRFLRHL